MRITPIRIRRINQGITMEQAMKVLGIKQGTIYKYETGFGTPSQELVLKMAKLYKCKTDDIYKDLGMM